VFRRFNRNEYSAAEFRKACSNYRKTSSRTTVILCTSPILPAIRSWDNIQRQTNAFSRAVATDSYIITRLVSVNNIMWRREFTTTTKITIIRRIVIIIIIIITFAAAREGEKNVVDCEESTVVVAAAAVTDRCPVRNPWLGSSLSCARGLIQGASCIL